VGREDWGVMSVDHPARAALDTESWDRLSSMRAAECRRLSSAQANRGAVHPPTCRKEQASANPEARGAVALRWRGGSQSRGYPVRRGR
jgi:hypothetical protein